MKMVDADIPIHVVSYGGVGSKMLVKWLYPGREPSYHERAHHHWRFRPMGMGDECRFIYVFGDPRNTALSFFQRKETRHEGHGFAWSDAHLRPYPQWTMLAVRNLEADPVGLTPEWEVADIIAKGVDPFQFEDHFRRWLGYASELAVAFFRYETIWDQVQLLAELFGADASTFPPRNERRADWRRQPIEISDGLTRLYGGFAGTLADLPDAFVVEDGTVRSLV